MNNQNSKFLRVIKFIADANFYISVLILIYGCVTAISESYTIFSFNEELYGIMHNNLRMALLYMGMTEIVICLYCYATAQPRLMIFVGYFLLMMLGSLAFYGKINNVPIDAAIPVFFLYTGLSHIVYGMLTGVETAKAEKYFQ